MVGLDIYAVASHGLFAGGAGEVLNASPIKEILVTDSVATKENVPTSVKYLSASELIANAITVSLNVNHLAHFLHILPTRNNLWFIWIMQQLLL